MILYSPSKPGSIATPPPVSCIRKLPFTVVSMLRLRGTSIGLVMERRTPYSSKRPTATMTLDSRPFTIT